MYSNALIQVGAGDGCTFKIRYSPAVTEMFNPLAVLVCADDKAGSVLQIDPDDGGAEVEPYVSTAIVQDDDEESVQPVIVPEYGS